jgi:hypothetical protein
MMPSALHTAQTHSLPSFVDRRPSVVDSETYQHPPPLPHPSEASHDLRKEVVLRHAPEQVLNKA